MKGINVGKEVFEVLKDNSLVVDVDWVKANDSTVLEFITAKYLAKHFEEVTREEIADMERKIAKVIYVFKEEKIICRVELNSQKSFNAFVDEYDKVDFDYFLPHLIELNLLEDTVDKVVDINN